MADAESSTILDISQQLDLLIVQYFQTLADVFKYKQLLENDMKDGFINMAKVTVPLFLYYSLCNSLHLQIFL